MSPSEHFGSPEASVFKMPLLGIENGKILAITDSALPVSQSVKLYSSLLSRMAVAS